VCILRTVCLIDTVTHLGIRSSCFINNDAYLVLTEVFRIYWLSPIILDLSATQPECHDIVETWTQMASLIYVLSVSHTIKVIFSVRSMMIKT
jgi:hypothetical protein